MQGKAVKTQTPSQRRRRLKATGAVGIVICLVLVLFTVPAEGIDHPVRDALSGLGYCTCGPLSPILLLHPPFSASLFASALWLLYVALIGFTRLGLLHWSLHLILLMLWSFLGLMCVAYAGLALT